MTGAASAGGPEMSGWERRWAAPAACVLAAAVTLGVQAWAATDAPVGVFYDDGLYVLLAKGLGEGEGYRYLNLPGAPPGVHYPPAYPFVLSLLWRWGPAFPAVVPWMKALNALFMAGAAALTALYLARRLDLPPVWAAAVPVATLAAVPVLAVSTVLFSEPLFLVWAVAALWVADRPELSRRGAAAAGLLAGAAFLTRSVGLAVVAGVVWAGFSRGRDRGVAALVAASALGLPWLAWVGAHGGEVDPLLRANYGSYFAEYAAAVAAAPLATIGSVLHHNVTESLRLAGAIAAPRVPSFAQTAVVMAGLAAAAWAAVRLLRAAPALVVSLAAYVAGTLLWPFEPARYLFWLFPWVTALVVVAGRAAWRAIPAAASSARAARAQRVSLAVLGAALVLNYVFVQSRGYAVRAWEAPQRRAAEALWPLAEWVEGATSMGDVIATDGEPLVALYTGRRAVPNTVRGGAPGPTVGTPRQLATLLARMSASYLAISVPTGAAAELVESLARARPDLFRLVHLTSVGGRVFRIETSMLATGR